VLDPNDQPLQVDLEQETEREDEKETVLLVPRFARTERIGLEFLIDGVRGGCNRSSSG
jgi:hypothetical protein